MTAPQAAQAQSYTFNSVKVEGNQRIQTDTINGYLGIKRGTEISGGQLNDAYQRLLDSGVFETVELEPRGNTLVVKVQEFPTVNAINFEGNRRIKDDALRGFIETSPRKVFSAAQAERDAAIIAEAYSQQGRVSARVTPRIIRRSDNRVDLVFEIFEGDTIEIERISFVGNRAYSDRRLRQVMESKQAGLLRAFLRADTLIEERIEFDKQVLRDFYLSRGYVDFRVNSANVELTAERDAHFLVVNVTEGQQFRVGRITTVSEMPNVSAAEFQKALRMKSGAVYSPIQIETSIARQERLAIQKGIDFLRVEPRITRNERDLTLDVEFALTKGPRIFVERIDVEGNTTTLDRVIRRQFTIVEGDPFNPREIRQSAERIRALGFFAVADVDAREGSSAEQVIIDVNVEEQPTGSINLGGSYSVSGGFGIALGLTERNFLGRGQRLAFRWSNASQAEEFLLGFTEPALLGRDLALGFDVGYATTASNFTTYDTKRVFFAPTLAFPIFEDAYLTLRYSGLKSEMLARSPSFSGQVVTREIGYGERSNRALGLGYIYDSRITGLNPNAGFLIDAGIDYAGLGGDNQYLKSTARAVAQTRVYNEEIVLRASIEAGALKWLSNNSSRSVDRFVLTQSQFRGFEPAGIGPRDQSEILDSTGAGTGTFANDPLGGTMYAVLRLEADFPIGLPEELGIRGGVFYDVGSLWGLGDANVTGGTIVGANSSFRHVIGLSILWDSAFGPLRFNFSKALKKETFDNEQSFDLTISAEF